MRRLLLICILTATVVLAEPLPDPLQGDRWAFVTLPAGGFADLPDWDIGFGEVFSLNGLNLKPATPIPGFIIFSTRALPLAA